MVQKDELYSGDLRGDGLLAANLMFQVVPGGLPGIAETLTDHPCGVERSRASTIVCRASRLCSVRVFLMQRRNPAILAPPRRRRRQEGRGSGGGGTRGKDGALDGSGTEARHGESNGRTGDLFAGDPPATHGTPAQRRRCGELRRKRAPARDRVKEGDQGAKDKRPCVVKGEPAKVIKIIHRGGGILLLRSPGTSGIGATFARSRRYHRARRRGAHISILGHITRDERSGMRGDSRPGVGNRAAGRGQLLQLARFRAGFFVPQAFLLGVPHSSATGFAPGQHALDLVLQQRAMVNAPFWIFVGVERGTLPRRGRALP